jgi:hypothetical protein
LSVFQNIVLVCPFTIKSEPASFRNQQPDEPEQLAGSRWIVECAEAGVEGGVHLHRLNLVYGSRFENRICNRFLCVPILALQCLLAFDVERCFR